ncbi:hypothetical protein N566_22845 [Streptomycetaceae bacterium MP113-05]|nr:hypothetical protein N566_22845 [Streptomycetaceae bacterium MP113-05]
MRTDIGINLLDIELLTIKLRLLVASVDKAKEMGIDWWEHDPSLSSAARGRDPRAVRGGGRDGLSRGETGGETDGETIEEENERLRAEIARLQTADGAREVNPR